MDSDSNNSDESLEEIAARGFKKKAQGTAFVVTFVFITASSVLWTIGMEVMSAILIIMAIICDVIILVGVVVYSHKSSRGR